MKTATRVGIFLMMLVPNLCFSTDAKPQKLRGHLAGRVIDKVTKQPLVGANVIIVGTQMGASTNDRGWFVIRNVPVGVYTVKAQMIGYTPQIKTRVYVVQGRTRELFFELTERPLVLGTITVVPEYFPKDKDVAVSTQSLDYYEVRGDPEGYSIQRVLSSLPGVATAQDYSAQLIVRGGSPDENLTIIDNVEISNPIHFGEFGGAGGVISLINTELVKNIAFSSGGFPARYGDKLSSFLRIDLREGNREKHLATFDFNMAGVGLELEGPWSARGSYLFAYRRSYLSLLDRIVDIGTVIPKYDDYQFKVNFDPHPRHKLWIFGIWAFDKMTVPADPAFGLTRDLIWRSSESVLGLNWRFLFSKEGYGVLTLSQNSNWWDYFSEGDFKVKASEKEYTARYEVTYRLSPRFKLETGARFRYFLLDHYFLQETDTTDTGIIFPRRELDQENQTHKVAFYTQLEWKPFKFLSFRPGLRYDFFEMNHESRISPRVGLILTLGAHTWVNFSYGEFYQTPLFRQLLENELTSNHARHFVLGFEHLLRDDTLLRIEVYRKDLSNLVTRVSETTRDLSNQGSGFAHGVEILLDKKLSRKFYGKISYSYGVSKRRDYRGEYYFDWDQRHIFTLIGGIKFSDRFEVSFKWRFASGRPYTPLVGRYRDPLTGRWFRIDGPINSARYPDYHRLDLQFVHRFPLKGWSIISYFNLQNAYNRKNVFSYYWNRDFSQKMAFYQFTFMPVGGIMIEF